MKKLIYIIFFSITFGILFVACGNFNTPVMNPTKTKMPIMTAPLPTDTLAPTKEVTPTKTEVQDEVEYFNMDGCTDLTSDSINLNGVLVTYQYKNEDLMIEDVMPDGDSQFPNSDFGIAISPDFQRVIYIDNQQNQLVEIQPNGEKTLIAPVNENWYILSWNSNGVILWEENSTLENPFEPASLIEFDIDSGEFTQINTLFPDIVMSTERGTTWLGGLTSIYDPTMTYAIYSAQYQDGKSPLILWDLDGQTEINRIDRDYISTLTYPSWHRRGVIVSAELFLNTEKLNKNSSIGDYVSSPGESQHQGSKELFLVGYDGTLERLTYFSGAFYADQSSWSLSPDGRKLAFWLSLEEEFTLHPYAWELAILDLVTKRVDWFCLSSGGERRIPSPPIWSPDGSAILVTLGEDDIAPYSKLEIAIVDFNNNELAIQGEDKYGLGWLNWE